jgi:hypothetical protein
MIAGAILIAIGFLGLAMSRNKEISANPDSEPARQHVPTPPLPRLLDSSSQATEPDKFGLKAKE